MEKLIYVEARLPLRLFVRFDDGVEGEDDLEPWLRGPALEALRDPEYFARVRLAEHGAPLWPNGVDIAPDAIYERILGARDSRSAAGASGRCCTA